MGLEVVTVKANKEWEEFYSLDSSRRAVDADLLNVSRNPAFADAFMRPFLVRENGRAVSRAVGFFDKGKVAFSKVPVATFDRLVVGKSPQADRALLSALESWAHGWMARVLRGPVSAHWGNAAAGSGCGALLEAAGFRAVTEMQEFEWDLSQPLPPAMEAKALTAKTNPLVKVRPLRWEEEKVLEAESLRVAEVYNETWREAWNHAPVTPEEISYWLKIHAVWSLSEMHWIAEVQGEPAAIALCMAEVDRRAGPADKIRWALWEKNPLRGLSPKGARVVAFGVRPKFKYLGLSALLAWQLKESFPRRGFDRVVTDPVASDRTQALKFLTAASVRDKYSVYEKILGA